MARRALQYNVRPRFTCGSPAMVNPAIAQRVATQEKDAFEIYLEGAYGEEAKTRAEEQGLDFISFTMYETRKGWEVEDLITGKRHFWPYTATCPSCGAKKVTCQRGTLQNHWNGCSDRSYMGEERPTHV